MAWVLFDNFMLKQHNGNDVNFASGGDTLKIMIVDSTRAPVQATDADMVTIDDNEVTGSNYTAGGATLANQDVSLSGGTLTIDADDVTFAQHASGFSNGRYAVLYKSTGTPANDIPIAYDNFGSDKGNVAGDLVLQMDAAGIIAVTNA